MKKCEERRIEIDEIVLGIKELIDVSSMEELIEALDIKLKIVDKKFTLLGGEHACYTFNGINEVIYLSDRCPEEVVSFTLAHEVGHAILHDVELAHYKSLFKTGKIEEEANYFATKLLDLSFNVEDYEGYSEEEVAKLIGINEKAVKYLI